MDAIPSHGIPGPWRPAWLVVMFLVALGAAPGGCRRVEQVPPERELPAVTVAKPLVEKVTDYEYFTGRTDAAESVEIRARVGGYLKEPLFKPAAEVKAGQLLFEIDDAIYRADRDRAKADVERADARVTRLTSELERAKRLLPERAISQEEFEKTAGDYAEAQATRRAAQASLQRAEQNLTDTSIRALIAGRISRPLITAGNLVTQDTTVLTTIVSVDPVVAYFDMDEQTLLRLQALVREGKIKAKKVSEVDVEMGLANEKDRFPHVGRIDFFENRVDPTTGTLQLRAVFNNPMVNNQNRVLAPGLRVRVRVPLGDPYEAILVPERAIGSEQGQKRVYVVDGDDVVEERPVTVGKLEGRNRVIREGLSAEDRVIVEGFQRVRPKMKVKPVEAAPRPPAPPAKEEGSPRAAASAPAK